MELHLTSLAGTTQSGSHADGGARPPVPLPGLLVLWTGHRPQFRTIELTPNVALQMGRESLGGVPVPDEQMSKVHCEIVFDGRQFQLRDLDSRNGTFLDGARITRPVACGPGSLIRLGRTMMRTVADVRPLASATVATDQNYVVGPTLQAVLDRIRRSATGGANVLITGDNGTGKEKAAGAFHKAAAPRGPFRAVNCATLPPGTADNQLFGAGEKIYTGVKGGPGLIEEADGGVLFLDEVGELPPETQAKLLRAIENGEVLRSGETQPRHVKVRYVCATNRDVQSQMAAGTFREDLFHRLAHVQVRIPPLRERVEEIPFLVQAELDSAGRVAHHELIEMILLRPWTGNVRELINQVRAARLESKHDTLVRREDLEAVLDQHQVASSAEALNRTQPSIKAWEPEPGAATKSKPAAKDRDPGKDKLLELFKLHGSWSEVARVLGEERNTVNRWRTTHGLIGTGKGSDGNDG